MIYSRLRDFANPLTSTGILTATQLAASPSHLVPLQQLTVLIDKYKTENSRLLAIAHHLGPLLVGEQRPQWHHDL